MSETFQLRDLGEAIAVARDEVGMNQTELGRALGFSSPQTTVSRLEHGKRKISDEDLDRIAELVKCDTDALRQRAAKIGRNRPEDEVADSEDEPPSSRVLRQRAKHVNDQVASRAKRIDAALSAYVTASQQMESEFFDKLMELESTIDRRSDGLPTVDPGDVERTDLVIAPLLERNRADRLRSNAARVVEGLEDRSASWDQLVTDACLADDATGTVGGTTRLATAASTFAALATSAAIATPSASVGGAAAGAVGGAAAGTAMFATLVAAPAMLVAAGGALLMTKRNRGQRRQLDAQLSQAEAQLLATELNLNEFERLLNRVTEFYAHVAMFGRNELRRWADGGADLDRRNEFIVVAAGLLTLAALNIGAVLRLDGLELIGHAEGLDDAIDEVLSALKAYV